MLLRSAYHPGPDNTMQRGRLMGNRLSKGRFIAALIPVKCTYVNFCTASWVWPSGYGA